eukprot:jgi/Mesvir1/15905/Mv02808-RA.1
MCTRNMAVLVVFLLLCVAGAASQNCPIAPDAVDSGEDTWAGEFFPTIPYIKYEGPASKNPFSYKWYNADEVIGGKAMKDWLRFSVAFWHTFRGDGSDPFGSPTKAWPWEDGSEGMRMAKRRMRANFELLAKLGVDRWCFHDRDIAPEGATLKESNAYLDEIVALAAELQVGCARACVRRGDILPHFPS